MAQLEKSLPFFLYYIFISLTVSSTFFNFDISIQLWPDEIIWNFL